MAIASTAPPCPKCAGVLRRSYADDSAICRCGFTVDHEVIVACGGDAVRLLAAGRMTPIPDGTPGIRVGDTFGEVTSEMWDNRYVCMPPNSEKIGSTALECGAQLGLVYQGQAHGRYLWCVEVPPTNGAIKAAAQLERKVIYGIAPFGDVHEAACLMVKHIVDKHGPGRWWSMTDPVHIAADDGQARAGDVGGVPHVVLRAVFFHDPLPDVTCSWVEKPPTEARAERGIRVHLKSMRANPDSAPYKYTTTWSHAPVDPLDVEWDGWPLRSLLEMDVKARRENVIAQTTRACFTPLQRNAVSAHWSAELRKLTDAAKQKDRNQVTMEHDDE